MESSVTIDGVKIEANPGGEDMINVTVEEKETARSVLIYRLNGEIVRRSMIEAPFPFAVVWPVLPEKAAKFISFHISRRNAELAAKSRRKHLTRGPAGGSGAVVVRVQPKEVKV